MPFATLAKVFCLKTSKCCNFKAFKEIAILQTDSYYLHQLLQVISGKYKYHCRSDAILMQQFKLSELPLQPAEVSSKCMHASACQYVLQQSDFTKSKNDVVFVSLETDLFESFLLGRAQKNDTHVGQRTAS